MKTLVTTTSILVVFAWLGIAVQRGAALEQQTSQKPAAPAATKPAPSADTLDRLLAPVALYPDALLAQMLLCASNPGKVGALAEWLLSNSSLKGSELQDAATKAGFGPSFVALVLFPQVVNYMAAQMDWTAQLGKAFTDNRSAVFDSIQRLRGKAQKAGTLKSSAQQEVETKTTSSGAEVIVIEPTNPQVVYVPQYNPQVVYTQPATTTVVVKEDNSGEAVAAGLIGFTAGIAIGAAMDNSYYYGPHGWYGGGGYMYNDAWDDYYDNREDARDDWQDHREDLVEERGDRSKNAQEQRTERTESRNENRPEATQAQRDQAKTAAQNRTTSPETQAARDQKRSEAQTAAQNRTPSQEARGQSATQSTKSSSQATRERSGTKSDAFSGYSSGRSEGAASKRGQSSRSSSRSGGSRRR
ncbi:MAG: DUF3300 domain-containing protein [Vicinamibacterales bacterium]